MERIAGHPEVSPLWYRNTRRIILAHFPYGVFYVCKEEAIFIVAVFHFKKNPVSLRRFVRKRIHRL
jgi:toxin ParE1/3/4